MDRYQYVWLTWSGAFLIAFLLVFIVSQHHRRVMLRAGLATAPFGLTEPLFVPEYWNPPSLLDLAQRTGFDIESLIFAFSIGGVAVVLYDRLTGRIPARVPESARSARRHRFHSIALLTPALVFIVLAPLPWNPIYPAILAMALGAAAAGWCRPDLLTKTLGGGLLFLAYYAVFMLGLVITTPGYVEHVWNLPALSGLLVIGIPVEELLFGFAFGLYWASIYEHLTWSQSLLPRTPGTP